MPHARRDTVGESISMLGTDVTPTDLEGCDASCAETHGPVPMPSGRWAP